MHSSSIIALHGLPGSGKDTLADAITAHDTNARKFAFADAPYADVAALFDTTEALLRSREWKTQPQDALALVRISDSAYRRWLFDRGTKAFDTQTSRFHLQQYATDYMQGIHGRDYWAKRLVENLRDYMASDTGTIVISDLRRYGESFHELDALKYLAASTDRPFTVVRLHRLTMLTGEGMSHESNALYPDSVVDINLFNNGTPIELFHRFTSAMAARNHTQEISS